VQHFCRKQDNYSSPIFGGISLRDPVPPQTVGTVRVSIKAVASAADKAKIRKVEANMVPSDDCSGAVHPHLVDNSTARGRIWHAPE
jgi:hypothetical protein